MLGTGLEALLGSPMPSGSDSDTSAQCAEVYDFALGNLTVTCERDTGHGGPHLWTGRDGVENEVQLEWTATR